jgi:hypothetical protein
MLIAWYGERIQQSIDEIKGKIAKSRLRNHLRIFTPSTLSVAKHKNLLESTS